MPNQIKKKNKKKIMTFNEKQPGVVDFDPTITSTITMVNLSLLLQL